MAKVELTKIRLAVTAIEKIIVATIPNKAGTMMLHKHDVSSDFFKCIIDWGANSRFNIAGEEGKAEEYQVMVIKRKGFENATFSRKEAVKLLSKAVSDGVGDTISLEKWVEENMK
jgi:hypothetical protein